MKLNEIVVCGIIANLVAIANAGTILTGTSPTYTYSASASQAYSDAYIADNVSVGGVAGSTYIYDSNPSDTDTRFIALKFTTPSGYKFTSFTVDYTRYITSHWSADNAQISVKTYEGDPAYANLWEYPANGTLVSGPYDKYSSTGVDAVYQDSFTQSVDTNTFIVLFGVKIGSWYNTTDILRLFSPTESSSGLNVTASVAAVPEPASLSLMALAAGSLLLRSSKSKK